MQGAILTNDGYLFLELLDGSGDFSDGDMTVCLADLRCDGIGFARYHDIDAHPALASRVSRIRAAMLVNC